MVYRRTAIIKLDTPEGADPLLTETVEQFKHCANTASDWCWHGDDGYRATSRYTGAPDRRFAFAGGPTEG